MIIDYWRSDKVIINLGDYIAEILVRKFGHEPYLYDDLDRQNLLQPTDRCLWVIGTLLNRRWLEKPRCQIDIWGCGYGGDPKLNESHLKRCNIHAVRGPITRQVLKLPPTVPMGDPGLLLSCFWPITDSNPTKPITYVPHFNGKDAVNDRTLAKIGADRFLNIACQRSEFWNFIRAIAGSEFVLTSSLHGAIIAQSYGVPWALCVPFETQLNMPMKWQDWFAYLKVEGKICNDIETAITWWQDEGSYAQVDDLGPLIDSFPHNLANTASFV